MILTYKKSLCVLQRLFCYTIIYFYNYLQNVTSAESFHII